jgi:hypothetical protein
MRPIEWTFSAPRLCRATVPPRPTRACHLPGGAGSGDLGPSPTPRLRSSWPSTPGSWNGRALRQTVKSQRQLAREFGVSQGTISLAVRSKGQYKQPSREGPVTLPIAQKSRERGDPPKGPSLTASTTAMRWLVLESLCSAYQTLSLVCAVPNRCSLPDPECRAPEHCAAGLSHARVAPCRQDWLQPPRHWRLR